MMRNETFKICRILWKTASGLHASQRGSGFTLAELLVSSVVISTVMVGVYVVFLQAIDVEERASLAWDRSETAEAIVEHMTATLEGAVNLPEIVSIEGGPAGGDGEYFLTCTSSGAAGLQRRRYRWKSFGAGDDEKSSGIIELQTIEYAGTGIVTPIGGLEGLEEREIWNRIPSVVIGKRFDGISVLYRKASDPLTPWTERWNGEAGDVAVRIRVTVDGAAVEKIIVPQVNTAAM